MVQDEGRWDLRTLLLAALVSSAALLPPELNPSGVALAAVLAAGTGVLLLFPAGGPPEAPARLAPAGGGDFGLPADRRAGLLPAPPQPVVPSRRGGLPRGLRGRVPGVQRAPGRGRRYSAPSWGSDPSLPPGGSPSAPFPWPTRPAGCGAWGSRNWIPTFSAPSRDAPSVPSCSPRPWASTWRWRFLSRCAAGSGAGGAGGGDSSGRDCSSCRSRGWGPVSPTAPSPPWLSRLCSLLSLTPVRGRGWILASSAGLAAAAGRRLPSPAGRGGRLPSASPCRQLGGRLEDLPRRAPARRGVRRLRRRLPGADGRRDERDRFRPQQLPSDRRRGGGAGAGVGRRGGDPASGEDCPGGRDPRESGAAGMLLALPVAAFLVHNLFDFSAYLPSLSVTFAALAGIAARPGRGGARRKPGARSQDGRPSAMGPSSSPPRGRRLGSPGGADPDRHRERAGDGGRRKGGGGDRPAPARRRAGTPPTRILRPFWPRSILSRTAGEADRNEARESRMPGAR